jgi:hypothetical protein
MKYCCSHNCSTWGPHMHARRQHHRLRPPQSTSTICSSCYLNARTTSPTCLHTFLCIEKAISIPFYAYVERRKRSLDVILVSILVWICPCHNSYGHDDIVMFVATVNILFSWSSLIPAEFKYGTSCIGKVISLLFYAYIEHQKWSPDAILTSVLV